MTEHVFISYARADGRDYAEQLYSELNTRGIPAWYDQRNLDPNQDFTAEIEAGIEAASQVVVCLTPDIKRSDSFVRRELQYAMLSHKRIIPARFADVLPPIHIINLTWIDFLKLGWDQAFAALRERLSQPDSAYEIPATPDDPYRDYLKALYDQIVAYLQQTVFALSSALIELHAESSPDAVIQRQALPLAFFGQAGIDAPTSEHQQFGSFHEAFEYYGGRVLLLGDPGAGKTTTLLAFVRDAVAKRLEDPSLPLPISAPIATWDAEKQTPLSVWLAGQIPLLKSDDIASLINEGKTLLALDGLDELGSVRYEKNTEDKVENSNAEKDVPFDPRTRFLSYLPSNNPMIMSCRIRDYKRIGQRAALQGAITLHPLDNSQMQSYLSHEPDLWAALRADPDLREIARTPLLLSLFAFAYNGLDEEAKKLRDLGRRDLRDQIFTTYVHRRYDFETRKPNSPLKYGLGDIYAALGRCAMQDACESWRQNHFTYDDLHEIIVEEDLWEFVDEMILLHLLRPTGRNTFGFIHLLLRDYFAYPILLETLDDPNNWSFALYGLANITDSHVEDILVSMLQSRDYELLLDVIDLLQERVSEYRIISEVSWNLKDWNSDIRENSAYLLGELHHSSAVPPLIDALTDTSWFVAKAAAEALWRIGTPEALTAIEAWRQEQNRR